MSKHAGSLKQKCLNDISSADIWSSMHRNVDNLTKNINDLTKNPGRGRRNGCVEKAMCNIIHTAVPKSNKTGHTHFISLQYLYIEIVIRIGKLPTSQRKRRKFYETKARIILLLHGP